MNEKLKKVLKYIGVGAIGFLFGVGSLIGVSSCAQHNNNSNERTASMRLDTKKEEVHYTDLKINTDYVLTFRTGIDWSDIDLLSNMTTINGTYTALNGKTYSKFEYRVETSPISVDIILRNNSTDYIRIVNDNDLQYANANYFYANFSENEGALEFIDEIFAFDYPNGYSGSFDMAEVFNYNAPYYTDINETFVSDSNFGSGEAPQQPNAIHKTYTLPFFESNGQVFDTIGLLVINAYGTRYKQVNDTYTQYPTNNAVGFGYVDHIYYKNSITNYIEIWGYRKFGSYNDTNGNQQTYLDKGMIITNSAYRHIDFLEAEPNSTQKNYLAQFNDNNTFNGYVSGSTTDIGLSGAFTLLTTAFSSLIPLMSIQIIPGITIGLLLFIPLITGIILLVIWLVKR